MGLKLPRQHKKLHLPKKTLDKTITRVYNITCLKNYREKVFRLRIHYDFQFETRRC